MTLLAKGTSTEAKLEGGDMVDQGGLRRGDPDYRRAVIALFAMGLASFNAIYCTQALMPALSDYFGATPAM